VLRICHGGKSPCQSIGKMSGDTSHGDAQEDGFCAESRYNEGRVVIPQVVGSRACPGRSDEKELSVSSSCPDTTRLGE
jgi:hypothetical protein